MREFEQCIHDLKVVELKQIITLHVKSFLLYIDLGRRFLVSGVSLVNAIIIVNQKIAMESKAKVADHVRASKSGNDMFVK